ncbi:10191_t:CDS:1, partial [Dentiscutata erythropus]
TFWFRFPYFNSNVIDDFFSPHFHGNFNKNFNQLINYWEKEKENLDTVRKWLSYSRLVKFLGLTSAVLAVLNRNQNEKMSNTATSFA